MIMTVSSPPQLKLNFPAVMNHIHWAKLILDDIFDKHLKSVLEVSGCILQGIIHLSTFQNSLLTPLKAKVDSVLHLASFNVVKDPRWGV